MSVVEWCTSVQRLLDQFSGTDCSKLRSLRNCIPIEEFKFRNVDLTQYMVSSFLKYVQDIWIETVGDGKIKAVLVRSVGQSWIAFREELITWARVRGMPVSEKWLLAQLKANTEAHRDVFGAERVSSETWARVMDRNENMYNHAREDVQSSQPVAYVGNAEPEDAEPEIRKQNVIIFISIHYSKIIIIFIVADFT